MSLRVAPPIGAPSLAWDVEAELQKELDAVSISSHISSSSSSAGPEETFLPEEGDRTSNPLHKLLDEWRAKETKLQSFESMLRGIQTWQNDVLNELTGKGQKAVLGPSYDSPEVDKEFKEPDVPVLQREDLTLNNAHLSWIDGMTMEEPSGYISSCPEQLSYDLSTSSTASSYPRFGSLERAGRIAEGNSQLPEHLTKQSISTKTSTSAGFDRAGTGNTTSYQEDHDIPCCSTDYEDALSVIRKKRMRMLENYRAAETERIIVKSRRRQTETEEWTKRTLLASERRQELEKEILKEKMEKVALLDLEQAKQRQLFEELQRTEESDLEAQKQEMEQSSRCLMGLVKTYKHKEEELELRRLEQDEALDFTSDQEHKHDQAMPTTPDNRFVKCCVLVQAWVRGFICRKKFLELKYQNANAHVSAVLCNESEDREIINGQRYSICEAHEDMSPPKVSKEQMNVIHGQKFRPCEVHEHETSLTMAGEGIIRNSELIEEVKERLSGLAESGSMDDFNSCLALATSLGLNVEANDVEAQLIHRKESVQNWLEQVVQGWDTKKSKIEDEIQEARRLELTSIYNAAEAVMFAREKEIRDNLEASILTASRGSYNHWMSKAKIFGLEVIRETYSNYFQTRLKIVKDSLKREAKLGTKKGYGVLFENATSLGLQVDIRLALKILLKRVLLVFKRAILLECTPMEDYDLGVQDWNRVEMEGAEIGLNSQILSDLRQTVCDSRNSEFVTQIWANTLATNDTGGPCTIFHENSNSGGNAKHSWHGSEWQLVGGFDEFSRSLGISLSTISGGPVVCKSITIRSMPQNWPEMTRLQRHWQQHVIDLRALENDDSNYSQYGAGYLKLESDSLPASCVGDKICRSTMTPIITKHLKEGFEREDAQIGSLNSGKGIREEEEESVESDDDLRQDNQAHVSEVIEEQQKITPRKSTLTRKMLEEKLNCDRTELRWIMKLDLTDEHLKSLGRADLFRWCPRLRFLTVDMNKLTTLRGVFLGGEDCLEQLSARENLLQDMVGLECLHKLIELHLDGNSLSQLGLPLASPTLMKENGKKERSMNVGFTNKNRCNLSSQLEGSPVLEFCWSRLQVLTVGCNRLTSILKVGRLCPNLEVLDLGSNQLASLGDAEGNSLAGLHHLRVLDVGQNRLKGRSLWKGLENCPELVSLVASRNKLRELPNHFGSVLLREIWLNGNAIKRLACKAWLPSLQRLYLQDNMIDTLESLWGCPALEVLDLSFNSISELSHLQHLSCFPCLRSLQLNDNPVSEQEDHVDCVLQAVPWLAELDNEAVAKASRAKAIARIFKRIMEMIGLEFLKEKLSRGGVLLHGFAKPSGRQSFYLYNTEHTESGADHFLLAQEVNNVLNGEADEASLWEILLEAKILAASSSTMQNLLTMHADLVRFEGLRILSESELEARSNMIAYQQMTFGLKGRLHAATKERCMARLSQDMDHGNPHDLQRPVQVQGSHPIIPFLNISSEAQLSCDRVGGSNLEWCLEEHTTFDSNTCREIYSENREYKLQAQAQIRRVVRLQALLRGFLTRIRVKLLRELKTAMLQKQEHEYACKIQALWRGWRVRQAKMLHYLRGVQYHAAVIIQAHWRGYSTRLKFQQAIDAAKYIDNDEFEYVAIDDSEFIAGELALARVHGQSFGILPSLDNNASKSATQMLSTPVESVQPLDKRVNPVGWGSHDVNQLICPFECDTQHVEEAASLAPDLGVHANQPVVEPCFTEVSQRSYLYESDTQFGEDTTSLTSDSRIYDPEPVVAEHRGMQGISTGLQVCKESEKSEEDEERETNSITDLLKRIELRSKLNMHTYDAVSIGIGSSEEVVLKKVEEQLEGVAKPLAGNVDHIIPDEREPSTSSMPLAEVKKRATADKLAKDWGFKNPSTAQALCKARERAKQQAKTAAYRNLLQDPELRLKRFRETAKGQAPAVGAPTRQFEQRAPLTFPGHTLELRVDDQESSKIPEPENHHKIESSFVPKLDGSSSLLPIPRLPHQKKKCSFTESVVHENKKDKRNKPTKSFSRDLAPILLPKIVLNTALQNSSFIDLNSNDGF